MVSLGKVWLGQVKLGKVRLGEVTITHNLRSCILMSWLFLSPYKDFVIEEQIETLVYDAGNFLAAVGGNLGLFLGFSCLTMLLGIVKFVKKNWGRITLSKVRLG